GQLEVVAVEQVDAVERRILRRGRDLRDDVVVLLDQAGANGLRSGIRKRLAGRAAGRRDQREGAGAAQRNVVRGSRGAEGERLARIVVGGGEGQRTVAGQRSRQ